MPFEVFRRDAAYGRPAVPEPVIKSYKSGKFQLNKAALEQLEKPVEVLLMFDQERKAVGLKPVPEGTPDAYRINPSNRTVGTEAFFKAYSLPRDKTYQFTGSIENGILVFEIGQDQPQGLRQVPGSLTLRRQMERHLKHDAP